MLAHVQKNRSEWICRRMLIIEFPVKRPRGQEDNGGDQSFTIVIINFVEIKYNN